MSWHACACSGGSPEVGLARWRGGAHPESAIATKLQISHVMSQSEKRGAVFESQVNEKCRALQSCASAERVLTKQENMAEAPMVASLMV